MRKTKRMSLRVLEPAQIADGKIYNLAELPDNVSFRIGHDSYRTVDYPEYNAATLNWGKTRSCWDEKKKRMTRISFYQDVLVTK